MDLLANEALGDANNLKGTTYHLLYALWLLLHGEVANISFYAGNDLFAKITAPPPPTDESSLSTTARATSQDECDLWIQLKCTSTPWTCSELLADNLLSNFICNSFVSENSGRNWAVRLTTPAEIRTLEINDFASNPEKHSQLRRKLDSVLQSVMARFEKADFTPRPSADEIRERALQILKQLGECDPTYERVIIAEITSSLICRLTDRRIARDAENALVGAMLKDANCSKPTPRQYDRRWMLDVTGHDFLRTSPLDESVISACDQQVSERLAPGYNVKDCAQRPQVLRLLDSFLCSSTTLFLLTGRSGTGKSWLLSDWASRVLAGRVRLLTSGTTFAEQSTLESHVAHEIRHLSSHSLDDARLLMKFLRAGDSRLGPPVVIIDDLRPSIEKPIEYAHAVARFVEDARSNQTKVVISCQSDLFRNVRPFRYVSFGDIFRLDAKVSASPGNTPDETITYTMDDYFDDEFQDAVSRRVTASEIKPLLLQLRDPVFAPIRNPYVLGVLNSDLLTTANNANTHLLLDAISRFLDDRIEGKLRYAEQISDLTLPELQQVLLDVTATLWENRGNGISRLKLRQHIVQKYGEPGGQGLDSLYHAGILFLDTEVTFAEVRVGARCMARCLHQQLSDNISLANQLRWESDYELAAQLIAIDSAPLCLATVLTDRSDEWIPAVSEGLLYRDPRDSSVASMLVVLSRRDSNEWAAAEAFGRFSLKDPVAGRELLRRFVTGDGDDRAWTERAVWAVTRLAPKQAIRSVRTYFRLSTLKNRRVNTHAVREKDQWEYRRRLARALSVLGNVEGEFAGGAVLRFLSRIETLTADSHRTFTKDKLSFAFTDPIVVKFDEVRALASFYGNQQQFDRLVAALESPDEVDRARSINSLFIVSRAAPEAIEQSVLRRLATEHHPLLLARLLWCSYHVAVRNPESTISALETDSGRLWAGYEVAASTISLLEAIAQDNPQRVSMLIPTEFASLSEEAREMLGELVRLCRFQCGIFPSGIWEETRESAAIVSRDNPLQLYRLRSKAAAAIMIAGHELGVADTPKLLRYELRDKGPDFFSLDLSTWVKGSKRNFLSHGKARLIIDLLVAAVCSESLNEPDVLDKWHRNVRFFLVRDCIDVLAEMLAMSPDPGQDVRRLPDDWQRMYIARQLFKKGVHDPKLIDIAVDECDRHEKSATAQASSERNECLIALQRIVPNRVPKIEDERFGLSWFFGGNTSRLAAKIDEDSSSAITSLEETIAQPADALLLRKWHAESRRWSSLMVSEAYSRMFRFSPLCRRAARELVERQLAGLDGFPTSTARHEHMAVYRAILDALNGNPVKAVQIRANANMPIPQSHKFAVEILRQRDITRDVSMSIFLDRRGWFEDHNHAWNEDGTISRGGGEGYYLVVFFPAVRLALFAIGARCNWNDPAFTWMQRRRRAVLAVKQLHNRSTEEHRRGELDKLTPLIDELPEQDVLYAALGQLFLEDGQLGNALAALTNALNSPLCVGDQRGGVLYNLACFYSQSGDEQRCREKLHEANSLRRLDVDWLGKDPDLAPVRSQLWFKELIDSIGQHHGSS